MKCVNCHNKMMKTERFCHRCGFDMEEYQKPEYARMAARRRNRWLVRLGTIALILGGVASLLVQSDQGEVTTALLSTAQTLQGEMDVMVETLPLLSHLASAQEEVSTTQLRVIRDGDSLETTISIDPLTQSVRGDVTVDGFGFLVEGTIQASLQHLTIQMDRVEGTYGIDLTTLKEDLQDFSILDLSPYAAYYDYDMVSGYDQVWTEIKTHLTTAATQILATVQVEEVGEESLNINGDTVTATGYRILWDYDALEQNLQELGENLIQNQVLKPYLQTALTALQQYSRYLAPADVTGLQELWNNQVRNLVDELEESTDVQMVYLYRGRTVLLASLDEYLEKGWALALNPEGDILDYVAVGSLTDFQLTTLVALSARLTGEALEMELSLPYGDDVVLDYDYYGQRENLVVRYGYHIWTFDVDGSGENQLILGGDGWSAESVLGGTKDWFTQTEEYQNILRLSMMDYFTLAKQLGLL